MKTLKPSRSITAIIAGGGVMPKLIVQKLIESSQEFIVLAVKGDADPTFFSGIEHCEWIDVGGLKNIINILKNHKVTDLVFSGKVSRPPLLSMSLDSSALMALAKLGFKKLSGGSDNIHSIVAKIAEDNGFRIIPPEAIATDLRAPYGIVGNKSPSKDDLKDIEKGKEVLRKLGDMDVGQAVIVENEQVLGIEAAEGTDQLINRCGDLKREKDGRGVLIKMKKTTQENRIDLPAIGEDTIKALHASGFGGVAIEAKNGLILDLANVKETADRLGIFVIGVNDEE